MDKLSNHSTLLLAFFTSILLRLGSLSHKSPRNRKVSRVFTMLFATFFTHSESTQISFATNLLQTEK